MIFKNIANRIRIRRPRTVHPQKNRAQTSGFCTLSDNTSYVCLRRECGRRLHSLMRMISGMQSVPRLPQAVQLTATFGASSQGTISQPRCS